ncbi:hypothetical protein Goarm_003743 [Gossypium armourianum]|uniref:Inosine/uridine-preferring nucleoside hydrolase domain-containing protein n=1 Tax=Gossypium armourianum TaxID=34283 RepID=A0A7J9K4B5_9ROSI|nr:hypothetical protein [Gossypium armourianum]
METTSVSLITMFVIEAYANLALFLMNNPKNNVEDMHVMGGGLRSNNPNDCGYLGNLFTDYNIYVEFNIFGDPFTAYQVLHSGITITIVPLDATNTIPLTKEFLKAFEESQGTYEVEYCFRSLNTKLSSSSVESNMLSYFMWDSLTVGVAVSIMHNSDSNNGENEFAKMEYMNIIVNYFE